MKPLSKKIRKISLTISLLAFLIIGPIVLAYSMGYRFNQLEEKFGFVRTGGIYIHSDVGNTRIYVNTEYYKNTGNFLRNVLVQNLKVDENHVIEVQKDDYYSWAKKLPVFEGHVTEAKTLLIPVEIEKEAVYPFVNIEGVGTTTDDAQTIFNQEYEKLEILFGLASSTADLETSIVDEISNQINQDQDKSDFNVQSEEAETDDANSTTTDDVPEYFIELGIENPDELLNLITNKDEVAWIENGNVLINWIDKIDEIPYYFCNFKECEKQIILDWESEITKFDFMPERRDVLLVLNQEGLWAVEVDDRSTRNIFPIYLEENIDFMIDYKGQIIILDQNIFYELDF